MSGYLAGCAGGNVREVLPGFTRWLYPELSRRALALDQCAHSTMDFFDRGFAIMVAKAPSGAITHAATRLHAQLLACTHALPTQCSSCARMLLSPSMPS
jgi:hypothetical protein